jgi:hypothetical protein
VMDLSGSLAYQLVVAFSNDMINDLVRVVSSPPNETIATSQDMINFHRSNSP